MAGLLIRQQFSLLKAAEQNLYGEKSFSMWNDVPSDREEVEEEMEYEPIKSGSDLPIDDTSDEYSEQSSDEGEGVGGEAGGDDNGEFDSDEDEEAQILQKDPTP